MKNSSITLQVPNDWSPRQVLAFLDLLEALHQALWDAYEKPLVDIIIQQSSALTDDELPSVEFDDDIPF